MTPIKIVDFSDSSAVFDVEVCMYCKLNGYMKISMCLRLRSFFVLGPRSLRFHGHQHFLASSPQKL